MKVPAASGLQCSVERGELLPPASGGAEALCGDIAQAAAGLGEMPTSVSVTVVSPYSMAAVVTVGGKQLPEIKMASMDRELGRESLRRFAQAIATAAKAQSQP